MDTSIYVLIGAVGTCCSIVFGYLGYHRGLKKDAYQEGDGHAELRMDIKYIKQSVSATERELKEIGQNLTTMSERVTRVEESVKSAHKRIDAIGGGRARDVR